MRKAKRLGAFFMCIVAAVVCLALAIRPAAAVSPRVDLDLVGAGIADVFRALAELGDMNIVLDPAVSGTLTIRLHDLTVEEALKLVAYTTGVEYRVVGSSLIVTPPGKPSAFDPVRVERFSLTHARVDDVMPVLELAADNTKLQADPRTNSVIARGSAAGLEQVKQVISMLDVAVAPPEAQVQAAVGEGAKAKPLAIPAPVESLDIVKLRYASAKSVAGLLSLVVPSGKIQADSEINAIVMLADEVALGRAHEIIAQVDAAPAEVPLGSVPATVKTAESKTPAEADAVRVIKLSWSPAEKVAEALRVVVEGVRIGTDSRTNSLVVRAGQSEMLRVEEIASLLDVPVAEPEAPKPSEAPKPEPRVLTSFSLVHADPNEVQRALALVVPAGAVHPDARTRSLLVFGTSDETARAREMIALLDAPMPAPAVDPAPKAAEPDTLKATVLEYADVQVVRDALSAVLPSENIIVDPRTSRVIVRGTPAQHALASEIVAMLDAPEVVKAGATKPAEAAPVRTVHAFRLAQADPIAVRDALSLVMPRDAVHVDTHTRTALVLGLPDEIAKAAEIVALLDTAVAPAHDGPTAAQDEAEPEPLDEPEQKQQLPTNVMRVVRLEHAKASETREVIASAVPGVGLTADSRTNSLIIVGPDELQARVDQLVAELDVVVDLPVRVEPVTTPEPGPVTESVAEALVPVKTVHAFRLKQADPNAVREALALVLPGDAVHVDTRTRTAIVLGLPDDIAMASKIVDLLDTAAEYAEADQAETRAAAPAEATPEPELETAEVIRLEYAAPAAVRQALAPTLPESKMSVDERTASIVIVGTAAQRDQARRIIAQLDVKTPASADEIAAPIPQPEVMKVFRLTHAAASDMKTLLAIVAPTAKMQPDDRTKSLIVMAPASTLAALDELVRALDIPAAPSVQANAQPAPEPDPVVTRVYRLNHAVAVDVAKALEGLVKGAVKPDERTSSLVVEAAESQHARALGLIEALDRELPQVLIEARLEELSGDAGRRLGLDWSFNGLTFNQNAYGQWVGVTLDFLTNLTALEEQGKASLISKQHTFTVSGKTGKILIGDRIPVMIQEVQDGVAVTKLDFINAGIELAITPTVSEDGTITATVKPVISSIVGWTPQNYPQIRTRELETIVSLKSGNTAVIGGMLHRDEIESLAKVPILGDIPLLGEVFKKRSTTTENTEIVVMITAWQVNPGQRPVAGPATSGEKFPVKLEDAPTEKNPAN